MLCRSIQRMLWMDIQGRVALVTGGADGIGLETCKALLQESIKGLTIADNNSELGQKRQRELEQQFGKGRVLFIKTDITDHDLFEDCFRKTIDTFSGLDIVINNAGIFNDKQWEKEVDINLKGTIRGTMLAFKYLGRDYGGKGGVVVNVASVLGLEPELCTTPMYNATKHGIVGLSRSLGAPYHFERTGVRVVALCPGKTETTLGMHVNDSTVFNEEWMEHLQKEQAVVPAQKPSHVAAGVVHIIKVAKSGSVWVCDEGLPAYEIVIPSRKSLRTVLHV